MDGDDEGNTTLKDKINAIKRNGGRIFKYNDFFNGEPVVQSNKVTYGKDSRILFILHVLFAMEVIHLKTMLGDTLCRKRKTQRKHFIRMKSSSVMCPSCDDTAKCPSCDISDFHLCYFVILLLFSPNVAVLFITPFPYIVFCVRENKKDVFALAAVWIILSWLTAASVLMYVFWDSVKLFTIIIVFGVPMFIFLQYKCLERVFK